jgi:hypothetical protein
MERSEMRDRVPGLHPGYALRIFFAYPAIFSSSPDQATDLKGIFKRFAVQNFIFVAVQRWAKKWMPC